MMKTTMKKMNKVLDFEIVVYIVMTLLIPLFVTKGFTHEPSTAKHFFYVVGFTLILLSVLIRKKRENIEFNYVHVALLGIGMAALLSLITVASDNPQYLRYSLEVALYTFFLGLTAIYISNKFNTIEKIEITLLFFIIGASIVSIDALLNFYAGWDIFLGKVGEPFARASARSTIGNPNFVSDYMGMTIPLVLYFIISRKPLAFIFKGFGGQLILKIAMVTLLAPMVAAVFVSQTRTVITAIFVGNVVFLLAYVFLKKNRKPELSDDPAAGKFRRLSLIFLAIALIIVVVLAFLYLTPSPLTGQGDINITARLEYALTSSGSWKERFSAWENSIAQWFDSDNRLRIPFGTGIGSFPLYHLLYSPQVLASNPDYMIVWNNFKRTHNDYIQGLSEMGLIGFFFIIAMVTFLVLKFFKTLYSIDNKRDLLLYGALGAGIFSFAAHSFFEFPLHMQPNLMLALFISALAMGKYFAGGSRKLDLPRTLLAGLLIPLAGALIFLKASAFLGEGYFRMGQTDQQYYQAYYNQAQSLDVSALQEVRNNIDSFTGSYSYLADVSAYMEKKGNELKAKYPGASPIELLEAADNERMSEISRLKTEINNRLRQYDTLIDRALQYYNAANVNFKRSNRISPVLGKPLWYIAGLGMKSNHLEEARNNPELMFDVLTGEDEFTSDIIPEFKGSLEVIPLPEREIRTLPFKDIVSVNKAAFNNPELVNGLQLYFLTQLQMILDAADYYESSVILFSERQTPRILGRLYTSVNSELKKYYNFIDTRNSLIQSAFGSSEEFKKIVFDTIDMAAEKALYWFDLAVRLLPGTWNRYPDWKNVYLEYMTSIETVGRSLAEKSQLLLSVAERHAWAAENMGPDSPGDTLQYAIAWGKNYLSGEELNDYKSKLSEIYSRVVEMNRELIRNGGSITETKKEEINTLIGLYESLQM
jgi:O-antigen ligase